MKSSQPVNQKTIARELGLNQSTVSCILTGRNLERYHPDTRRKVVELARRLGYRPSRKARLLRGAASRMIGILDFSSGRSLERRCLQRICADIIARGYTPLPLDVQWFTYSAEAVYEVLKEQEVEGVVFIGSSDVFHRSFLSTLNQEQWPSVACLGVKPAGVAQFDVDRESAYYRMTSHLLASGRRFPAFLGRPSTRLNRIANPPSAQAVCGFERAAREAGITQPPVLLERLPDGLPGNDALLGRRIMQKLLKQFDPPDLVVAYNDLVATGAMTVCLEQGLRVPEDVAFMGFGNEDFSAHLYPALATVNIDEALLVSEVMAMLFKSIADPAARPKRGRQVLLQNACEFIFRHSSGLVSVGTPVH